MRRRMLLLAGSAWASGAQAQGAQDAADVPALAAIGRGGVVVALRHALAPGTFDPPEFRLGDCRTQRNLDDQGRAQARRIGAWFARHGLTPAAVRSSPWCRCMDTATLAFGQAQAWPALGSPRGTPAADHAVHQASLRQALVEVTRRASGFEVWVTHNFVLADLADASASSGEGLLLQAGADGRPQTLARLAAP